jgi:hypothetical protein
MSINHQIVSLEDNNKYFVLHELLEGKDEYCLILNLSDENDIKIVSKKQKNNKVYLVDISDNNLLSNLSSKFKESIKKEQEMYS